MDSLPSEVAARECFAVNNDCKAVYLKEPSVNEFVDFVADILRGIQPISHHICVVDPRTYPGFWQRMSKLRLTTSGAGTSPVGLQLATLEDAFNAYWWNRRDYYSNALRLERLQRIVRRGIHTAPSRSPTIRALGAMHAVLRWGAGGKSMKLYRSNMAWARGAGHNLPTFLATGCKVMIDPCPRFHIFSNTGLKPRMNAGLTKYYALAVDDCIIYDGRVGAAMGYLVRLFLGNPAGRKYAKPDVPNSLQFRWATGASGRRMDPSAGPLKFHKLNNLAPEWARCNVRANWVLTEARRRVVAAPPASADQPWWFDRHAVGLRQIEAALFVVGYEMP